MAKPEVKRFLFNCEWQDTLRKLRDSSRLRVLDAVIEYARTGIVNELNLTETIAFDFIRKEIDWNGDKYDEIRRRRSEAGKKGGIQSGFSRKNNKTKQNEANEANEAFASGISDNRSAQENQGLNGSREDGAERSKTKQTKQTKHNDNVNVNDNELSKDNKEKEIILKDNQEKEKNKRTSFVKPTIDEIRAYAKEKGYTVDAEAFWNFYESKGWMVGINRMKNWHSAVVTWSKGPRRGLRDIKSSSNHFKGEKDMDVYERMKQELQKEG